jgi:potassium uptake TrkH family protein
LFIVSFLAFALAIWDTGFPQSSEVQDKLDSFYKIYFACNGFLYVIRALLFFKERHVSAVSLTNFVLGGILLIEYFISILLGKPYLLSNFFHLPPVYKSLAALLFIFEFSRLDLFRFFALLNPPQIFIVSFGSIILTGALFLMMPQSTVKPIRFIDALFTSTSAVCVTGLTVVDTATRFTYVGKAIILALIQIGGIGIMTFTSFFAVFFKGTQSFREKQILKEWLNDPSLASIKKTLSKVILFVFLVEAIGILFIYLSLGPEFFSRIQRFRFAVFHSISAFCNAGFSTLSDNYFDYRIRYNISLLYITGGLFIIGGIGFPVVLNIYEYLKARLKNFYEKRIKRYRYVPVFGLINNNTRIVIITTLILIVLGSVGFYLLERHNTLKGLSIAQQIAVSFFSSTTPRTAGFNAVNIASLTVPALMLIIILMWIGASPVSTGGGIKTSTFALAFLNIFRIASCKDRLELFRREIDPGAISRAFAIMFFSLTILATGSFLIYLFEPSLNMMKILFECFSAYGTVGLSMGITPGLTWMSKLVLMFLMFFGRMGTITLLMVFIGAHRSQPYRYPSDTIVIT